MQIKMKTFTLNMQVTQSSVLLLENLSLEYQNCSQNHLDYLSRGRECAEDFPCWVSPSLFPHDQWNLKKENMVVTDEYQK